MKLVFDTSYQRITPIFDASEIVFIPQGDGTLKAILIEENGRFIAITESNNQPAEIGVSSVHTLENGDILTINTQGPPVVVTPEPEVPVEELPETPAEEIAPEVAPGPEPAPVETDPAPETPEPAPVVDAPVATPDAVEEQPAQ